MIQRNAELCYFFNQSNWMNFMSQKKHVMKWCLALFVVTCISFASNVSKVEAITFNPPRQIIDFQIPNTLSSDQIRFYFMSDEKIITVEPVYLNNDMLRGYLVYGIENRYAWNEALCVEIKPALNMPFASDASEYYCMKLNSFVKTSLENSQVSYHLKDQKVYFGKPIEEKNPQFTNGDFESGDLTGWSAALDMDEQDRCRFKQAYKSLNQMNEQFYSYMNFDDLDQVCSNASASLDQIAAVSGKYHARFEYNRNDMQVLQQDLYSIPNGNYAFQVKTRKTGALGQGSICVTDFKTTDCKAIPSSEQYQNSVFSLDVKSNRIAFRIEYRSAEDGELWVDDVEITKFTPKQNVVDDMDQKNEIVEMIKRQMKPTATPTVSVMPAITPEPTVFNQQTSIKETTVTPEPFRLDFKIFENPKSIVTSTTDSDKDATTSNKFTTNYIRNGGFEEERMKGWYVRVLRGDKTALQQAKSVHVGTIQKDDAVVEGNYKIGFWSKKAFEQKVNQTIRLKKGKYELKLSYKMRSNEKKTNFVVVSVVSKNKTQSIKLTKQNGKWNIAQKIISIDQPSNILMIHVKGNAGFSVQIDQVELKELIIEK